VLDPYSCDCSCKFTTAGYVSCDYPQILNIERCTCSYESVISVNDIVVADLTDVAIIPWNPCWTMEKAQAKCIHPWYWNPFTCRCECKQTVECLQPRYFSFEKCACVCPQFYQCPKGQVWDPLACRCKCNVSFICPDYQYWDWQ
jgi:hypothetical protein